MGYESTLRWVPGLEAIGRLVRDGVASRRWQWPGAFLFAYAFMVRDVRVGRLYAFGDYPPLYGWEAIDFFMRTWHPEMLGYAQSVNTLSAYVGVLTVVGGVLAQNVFYLLLIPGCFLTFRFFLGRFVSGEPARSLGAAVYALNPVTFGQFANGGANELLSVLGMPLVLHYLWMTAERDEWAPALKAGAVFGATSVIPWTAFWILFPYATYLLYRVRRTPRRAAKLLVAGVIGVVLTVPNLYYLLFRGESLSSEAALFEVVRYTYADATPLLVARLAGNRGSYAMQVLGYNDDPALLVGLIIPLVALVAWRRDRARVFFLTAAVLIGFVLATKHGLTYPLFEAVPPLLSLRNPNKIYYSLLVSAGVLFGVGIDELLFALRNRRDGLARTVMLAIVLLSLSSYAAPAADGLGLTATRGDNYYIPEEYETVADQLEGRVLWLPYSYTTELRLRHTYPQNVGVRGGGVVEGRENADFVRSLFEDVAAGRPIDDRLRALGVRNVVIDRLPQTRVDSHGGDPHVRTMNAAPYLFGDPAAFEAQFAESDDYELAYETEDFSVYRVVGAETREGSERFRGLHRVYYPTDPVPRPIGSNRLVNGDFEDDLAGWWTWDGETGTQTRIETLGGGDRAAVLTLSSGINYPLSQEVRVRKDHAYRLDVDAEGPGSATLVWYDGEVAEPNRVESESFALSDLPTSMAAPADLLSIRIRLEHDRLLVRSVDFRATTYPPETGFPRSAEGVPGVVVDGWNADVAAGTPVTVNANTTIRDRVDPTVRVVDAETVLAGDLVFDEGYRQGVAVRSPDGDRPAAVPPDARVVSDGIRDQTVIDYWVEGPFDETPVTVVYTSYHPDWEGPPGSTHFRAFGWANGFLDAEPEEVRWTGGDDIRRVFIGLWLLCWTAVLIVLLFTEIRRVRAGCRPPGYVR